MYDLIRDKKPKPKRKYVKCNWFSDPTSIAKSKQHTPRFPYENGKKQTNWAIVFYNKQTEKGFYTIINGNLRPIHIKTLIEKMQFRETFKHDKAFHYKLCPNGILEHGYRDKQIIEHLFGFKRVAYEVYEECRKAKLPLTTEELINIYHYYFQRLGLKEVTINQNL